MPKRVPKQIRWSQHELDTINEAREEQDFSDFVRNAAMEKAIEINDIKDA